MFGGSYGHEPDIKRVRFLPTSFVYLYDAFSCRPIPIVITTNNADFFFPLSDGGTSDLFYI